MPPPVAADPVGEINLLREWREPVDKRRVAIDAAGSVAINLLLFVSVVSMRGTPEPRVKRQAPDVRQAVHLFLPRFYEPTQKAPNKGKVTRELDVRSANPAPAPQSPKFLPPQPAPGPVAQAPQPVPTPVIEQPKIQVAANPPPPPVIAPQPPQPVQQPIAAAEPQKPKLAFESVGAQPITVVPPNRVRLPMPDRSTGAGGTIVGDIGDSTTVVPNINNTPSPGRIGSNLQLLSDPKGIDFKPYLIQILTAVRRNWLSIIPESARMGRQGRVLIQFAIDRTGGVPKLVIAEGAGAGNDSLDRAAVSSISASYPFPPLPKEYQGDQIRVQLAFSYNLPSR